MAIVKLLFDAKRQFFDDNGKPLSGGKLYTYQAGTSTEKATYSDAEGVIPLSNPVVLDSAGRATIFGGGAYKVVLKDADNVTVWTQDNITSSAPSYDVDTVADLKALTPGSVSFVRTLGRLTKNDGGGWEYYWDANSSAVDDGGMVLQPLSLPATGRYIGVKPNNGVLKLEVYGPALNGITDDTAVFKACAAYCNVNRLSMLISGSVYFATDPASGTTPLILTPNSRLLWGSFNPDFTLLMDINDITDHFNCDLSYVPVLSTAFLRPEWFIETATSHPKTTACLSLSLTSRKILFTEVISTSNTELN